MSNTITTPQGIAKYPYVNEPNTRFNPMGEYTCQLVIPEETALKFKEQLDKIYEDEYKRECLLKNKKLKKAPNFPLAQDEDGDWVLRSKQPAKVESKAGKVYEFSVKIFDAQGKLCDAKVGSGSSVKLAIEPRAWFTPALGFGITLNLKAVQVIELVEYGGGGGASSFGFAAEEGYVGEELKEVLTTDTAAEATDDAFDF
jgi:hypothetical protein